MVEHEMVYSSGDDLPDSRMAALRGFVAQKHQSDVPEQHGGGNEQAPDPEIEKEKKAEELIKEIEAIDDGLSESEKEAKTDEILEGAFNLGLLRKTPSGQYLGTKEYEVDLIVARVHKIKSSKQKPEQPKQKPAESPKPLVEKEIQSIQRQEKEPEKPKTELQRLQVELSKVLNKIRDLEVSRVKEEAVKNGEEKYYFQQLEDLRHQKEELRGQIENIQEVEKQKKEAEEKEKAEQTERERPVKIEEAVEKFMKSGSGGIGEALYKKIGELSGTPLPVKRGFLDRAYMIVFKNSDYKEYKAEWEKYNSNQQELKSLRTQEKSWAKKEQKLVAEYYKHEERLQELLGKEKSGEITKLDWKELQKITNKLVLMRENINRLYLKELAQKIGYEGKLPKSNWEGIKEDSGFSKKEQTEKAELIKILLSGEGKLSEKFQELLPNYQKQFLSEQGGESLRNLAQIKVLRIQLRETLNKELDSNNTAKNPQAIFQLTNALREANFQEKCAEKALEQQIKSYKRSQDFEKFGQEGKKLLKETFNTIIADTGDDFEIKYNTSLKDIILNGQSKTAGIISGYMQTNNMISLLNNRGQKTWANIFVFYQKGMEKYVPSREKSSREIEKLQERISVLEVKKDGLNASIKEITMLRAMVEAAKEDKARDEVAISKLDKLMAEAAKENRMRDEEIKAIWDNLMDEATREDNIRTIIHTIIEEIAPTKTREVELKKSFKENGLNEKFQDDLEYFCQMQVLMASREKKRAEVQLREEKEKLGVLDSQIDKSEGRLADEYSGEQEQEWEAKEKELEQQLRLANEQEEAVKKTIEEKVKKLREAAEKSLAKRIKSSLDLA